MPELPGLFKPELQDLPQLQTRISFLYLEHCKLNRESNAITVCDKQGIYHVPAAAMGINCRTLRFPRASNGKTHLQRAEK